MEKILRVYATHTEILPYEEGDYPELEDMCSTDSDPGTHKKNPIGFSIEDGVLYIPRGIPIQTLVQMTGTVPSMYSGDIGKPMKKRYKMTCPPKNKEQKEAIMFLLGLKEYQYTIKYTQLALVLQPGFGKTFCSVYAMLAIAKRTIIILHRDSIREQWVNTLKEKSNVDMERVLVINGAEEMTDLMTKKNRDKYDIYLVLHFTLASYRRTNGTNALRNWFSTMEFGLKITDEAHLCFSQTIETDQCANIAKNFYLTATFTRSDPREQRLFRRVFSNTARFGENLNVIKNVIYKVHQYNSNPTSRQEAALITYRGVSVHRFTDWAFKGDLNSSIYNLFFKVFEEAISVGGKIAVLIGKIEYCEKMKILIENDYPDLKIGCVNSKNSKDQNNQLRLESDVIISTISGFGTGVDISGLRSIIIMEPHSSRVTAKQLTGRLRPIPNGDSYEDSYVHELLDVGFATIKRMFEKREPELKRICKEVIKIKT